MVTSKIFKYTLPVDDENILKLPVGSKILSVAEQNHEIVLYALISDTDKKAITNTFTILIIGTGNPVPADIGDYAFIGTVKLQHGQLMFHVFYKEWI